MKQTVNCKFCGKEFSSFNPNPTYCSLKCKGLAQRHQVDEGKIISLYESGMTKQEVADSLGITRKIVENTFKRNGLKFRRAIKRDQAGPKNHLWAGNNPSYGAAHKRLVRKFGNPKKCDFCGTTDESKKYDWANLTGDYSNINDFRRLCRSCHWKHDQTRLNFTRGKSNELSKSLLWMRRRRSGNATSSRLPVSRVL